jgi:uncharacterized protein YbcI
LNAYKAFVHVGFFFAIGEGKHAMDRSTSTMAEQIAQVATVFQQQLTGHEPKSVSVALSGDTLVVILHGALSPAEQVVAQSPEGAAKVREFHRHLFLNAANTLEQDIKRITGMNVREAVAEVEPVNGAVVQVFTSGNMVHVYSLSGKVPSGNFNTGDKT